MRKKIRISRIKFDIKTIRNNVRNLSFFENFFIDDTVALKDFKLQLMMIAEKIEETSSDIGSVLEDKNVIW